MTGADASWRGARVARFDHARPAQAGTQGRQQPHLLFHEPTPSCRFGVRHPIDSRFIPARARTSDYLLSPPRPEAARGRSTRNLRPVLLSVARRWRTAHRWQLTFALDLPPLLATGRWRERAERNFDRRLTWHSGWQPALELGSHDHGSAVCGILGNRRIPYSGRDYASAQKELSGGHPSDEAGREDHRCFPEERAARQVSSRPTRNNYYHLQTASVGEDWRSSAFTCSCNSR